MINDRANITKIMRILLLLAMTMLTMVSADAQNKFDEMIYTKQKTYFCLNTSDQTAAARVNLYHKANDAKPYKVVEMKSVGDNQWIAIAKGNLKGQFYTFQIGLAPATGNGGVRWLAETPGVFAKAVGTNGRRAAIIEMKETDPAGWESDRRLQTANPVDLVIYEMHHRDFSIDASSGVTQHHRGKFLALTEPVAVTHLRKLGINAVHILPSFDFASVDESKPQTPQYNWGYDPLNYNVPEGSYSTNAADPKARIREFKQMVQSLHKAGIRVFLDVVYNHTFNIENSNFQLTWPDAYYRKTADGKYSNGSGCGNETASERPLMRRFMIESMMYWVQEYHIDGFRVDLMGVHDIETMNEIRRALDTIDPTLFIYGEGWSAGDCALPRQRLAMKENISALPRIAAFSDELRDALRGPFTDDTKGAFLAGIEGEEESLKAGIAGMVAHQQVDYSKVNYSKKPWAKEPSQMISYVSCHDDMCLVDRLKASVPDLTTDQLIRLDKIAQTVVFVSQGVPFILSGEEMLRTKQGVHNSFESPDAVNHLDWKNLKRYPDLVAYYSGLMTMRRNHKAFRLGSADLIRKHLEFLPTQECLVAFQLKGNAGGDPWRNITVIINSSDRYRLVNVPRAKYTVVCKDGRIDERGIDTFEGSCVQVHPQSVIIMHE